MRPSLVRFRAKDLPLQPLLVLSIHSVVPLFFFSPLSGRCILKLVEVCKKVTVSEQCPTNHEAGALLK